MFMIILFFFINDDDLSAFGMVWYLNFNLLKVIKEGDFKFYKLCFEGI